MRVALFASGGDIPMAALRALGPVAEVAAIIRPGPARGLVPLLRGVARRVLRGAAPPDPLATMADTLGIPQRAMHGPADTTLAPFLRDLRPDVACVATFAWRLRPEVLLAPRLGTINVHASLLPRHRGPNPWFWTYYHDDRETGVTVHSCAEAIDTGAILGQARWPLERGYPVASLHHEVAEHGAQLLVEHLASMASGADRAVAQDDARATYAGRVAPGRSMVDFGWPVERVWHFLAGLAGQFHEPLRCDGQPVRYRAVPGFESIAPQGGPGSVERYQGRWRLWCRDGYVLLEPSA